MLFRMFNPSVPDEKHPPLALSVSLYESNRNNQKDNFLKGGTLINDSSVNDAPGFQKNSSPPLCLGFSPRINMLRFIVMAAFVGLLLPTVASAQRRGGSYGGQSWNGSQGYGSRSYGSWDGNRGNWNNYGNRNYYGGYLGLGGIGGFYSGYYGLGGYYGGYNAYPYSSYDLSGYSVYQGSRNSSAYYDPTANDASLYQNSNPAINANRARVEVILPDAGAELLIQGQRMELTGRQRIFVSPELVAGKSFSYTITMRRMINGSNADATRKIEVQAGSNTRVDFTIPEAQQVPKPASTREDTVLPLPR